MHNILKYLKNDLLQNKKLKLYIVFLKKEQIYK